MVNLFYSDIRMVRSLVLIIAVLCLIMFFSSPYDANDMNMMVGVVNVRAQKLPSFSLSWQTLTGSQWGPRTEAQIYFYPLPLTYTTPSLSANAYSLVLFSGINSAGAAYNDVRMRYQQIIEIQYPQTRNTYLYLYLQNILIIFTIRLCITFLPHYNVVCMYCIVLHVCIT